MRSFRIDLPKIGRWILEVLGIWLLTCIAGPIFVYLKHGKQGLIDHPFDAELAICLLVFAVFVRAVKIPLWNRLFDRIEQTIPARLPSSEDLVAGIQRDHNPYQSLRARRRRDVDKRRREAKEARRADFEARHQENRRRFGPTGNELRALNRRFEGLIRLTVIQ